MLTTLRRPFDDLMSGLDEVLRVGGTKALLVTVLGLLAGFWIYVPLHEMGHALACLATGGTVTRLEIAPHFGGAILERFIPWVVSGGEYAGRLAGFDTGGNDWIYLATDLGPFLMTIPGVWLLRRAARAGSALGFGASLSFAFAPFLSLNGDAYEIGSILTTQIPPWSAAELLPLLRGDDIALRFQELRSLADAPWGGFAVAALLGVIWAWGTYRLADWLAARMGQPPLNNADRAP